VGIVGIAIAIAFGIASGVSPEKACSPPLSGGLYYFRIAAGSRVQIAAGSTGSSDDGLYSTYGRSSCQHCNGRCRHFSGSGRYGLHGHPKKSFTWEEKWTTAIAGESYNQTVRDNLIRVPRPARPITIA